jgi:hypothetical protein
MATGGFDFNAPCIIEFNVDVARWPPPSELVSLLKDQYPSLRLYEPYEGGQGYIQFVVQAKLTYELVAFVQESVSHLAAPFGGVCESWGVLH